MRSLREKGMDKIILESTIKPPPTWWQLAITQNPNNIHCTHTSLNAKHQAIMSGSDASATPVTAPTQEGVVFEYGDDDEKDQVERIL